CKDLRDPSHNPGDLKEDRGVHKEPEPDQPRDLKAWSRDAVHRLERAHPSGDGEAAELDLDKDLDHAGQDDEPQEAEADLSAQLGGDDELTRADDRGGHDQAWPEVF